MWGVSFILRQKKGTCSQLSDQAEYQSLKSLDIQPVTIAFFRGIHHTESH